MARFEDYRVFKTAVGGRLLQLEIGKVCEQANGQVMVKYGDTVVNVTACASKEPKPDIDFSRFRWIMKKECMPPARYREALSREKEDQANTLYCRQD